MRSTDDDWPFNGIKLRAMLASETGTRILMIQLRAVKADISLPDGHYDPDHAHAMLTPVQRVTLMLRFRQTREVYLRDLSL